MLRQAQHDKGVGMGVKNSQVNKVKDELDSTIKALAADQSLQIDFNENCQNNFFNWNQSLIHEEKNIVLPQVQVTENFSEENLIRRHRASADMALCYFLSHKQELHKNNFEREDQKLFDEFEKIRVITKVKNRYLGVVKNILEKIEGDVMDPVIRRGDIEGRRGDMEYFVTPSYDGVHLLTIPLLLLKHCFPEKILPNTEELVVDLEEKISAKILQEIKNLAKKVDDQQAFALGVERLIEMLKQEQEAQEKENKKEQGDDNLNNFSQEKSSSDVSFGQENVEENQEKAQSFGEQGDGVESLDQKPEELDMQISEEGGKKKIKSQDQEESSNKIEYKNAYKIYTSKFDEVVFPQKLISKNELEMLRDQLDLKLSKLNSISKKMSLKLKRKLLARKDFLVERDNNHGILDRKKLSRFVIDPFMEDIWVNNKQHQYQDTALTILLDNSGSMRGAPIVMSALACEIIAEILEKFSVKTEIIGYTTADWKGGRARKAWENAGKPKNPGRLNELRHIIYKSSSQNFKKSKINLGLMLKEGILKENIDGEALLFAKARLMQQDAARKILLVISDGTPIDDSTNSANDNDILIDHLHHVVSKIEKQSKIEVIGIGIGHQVSDFYKNSISIKTLEELGDVMIEKIVALI